MKRFVAKVLDFNDLIQCSGEAVVWVEIKGETFCHLFVYAGGADGGSEGQEFFHNPDNGEEYAFVGVTAEYGVTWRCWTSDPTTDEREREPWQN